MKVSNKHIQCILFKEREKKYPFETEFLNDIKKITLNLDMEGILYKNTPFCFMINKIINPEKNNREETFIIYTSICQLKHFIKSKEIYFDINYKIIPKNYLQLLTIFSYDPESKKTLPIFNIPMTCNSKLAYKTIFDSIDSILEDNNLIFDDKNLIFMCDFEHSLYKAIKEKYPYSKFKGCYFHYLKCLWKKAKRSGLCQRCIVESTKKIIFAMAILPLLKKNNINSYLNEIIDYIKGLPENYRPKYDKYILFIKNNWINTKYVELESIMHTNNFFDRDNFLCEMYHMRL